MVAEFPGDTDHKCLVNQSGVGSSVPVGLLAATEPAVFAGTVLVLLANK